MAAYALNFNLLSDVWDDTQDPTVDPAIYVNMPTQLYVESRPGFFFTPPFYQLRFPVDLAKTFKPNYIFETPVSSGRFYHLRVLYWMHYGFPNEYWCALADPDGNVMGAAALWLP